MQYSQSDINNMRQDALRRTREMHRQSRNSNVQAAIPIEVKESEPEKEMPFDEIKSGQLNKTIDTPKQNQKGGNFIGNILSDILGSEGGKLDSDKIIIIALIFILAKEGADLKLLLALGYILM